MTMLTSSLTCAGAEVYLMTAGAEGPIRPISDKKGVNQLIISDFYESMYVFVFYVQKTI